MQIVQQTRHAIRLGRLAPGDRLPSAREVVTSTGINPNTVQKAYRQLEFEGLVEGRAGSGTFVVDAPNQGALGLAAQLGDHFAAWMREAQAAGFDAEDVKALFAVVLKETFGQD